MAPLVYGCHRFSCRIGIISIFANYVHIKAAKVLVTCFFLCATNTASSRHLSVKSHRFIALRLRFTIPPLMNHDTTKMLSFASRASGAYINAFQVLVHSSVDERSAAADQWASLCIFRIHAYIHACIHAYQEKQEN